jgi:hypothetical protein
MGDKTDYLMYGLAIGISVLFFIYLAARIGTAGVLKSIQEWKQRRNNDHGL